MTKLTVVLMISCLCIAANASVDSSTDVMHFQFDCGSVDFAARLIINNDKEGNLNGASNYTYDIPLNESKIIAGTCGYLMDVIFINWVDKNYTANMKLTFTFNHGHEDVVAEYMLSEIAFYIPAEILNIANNKTQNLFYRGDILETALGTSYCPKSTYSLPLTNEYGNHFMGTLELYNLCFTAHSRYEAEAHEQIIIFLWVVGLIALGIILICVLIGLCMYYICSDSRNYRLRCGLCCCRSDEYTNM